MGIVLRQITHLRDSSTFQRPFASLRCARCLCCAALWFARRAGSVGRTNCWNSYDGSWKPPLEGTTFLHARPATLVITGSAVILRLLAALLRPRRVPQERRSHRRCRESRSLSSVGCARRATGCCCALASAAGAGCWAEASARRRPPGRANKSPPRRHGVPQRPGEAAELTAGDLTRRGGAPARRTPPAAEPKKAAATDRGARTRVVAPICNKDGGGVEDDPRGGAAT